MSDTRLRAKINSRGCSSASLPGRGCSPCGLCPSRANHLEPSLGAQIQDPVRSLDEIRVEDLTRPARVCTTTDRMEQS